MSVITRDELVETLSAERRTPTGKGKRQHALRSWRLFHTEHVSWIWPQSIGLPAASQYREFAEAGGLLSYGPNLPDHFHRAAVFVDKILKGAKACRHAR